MKIEIKKIGAGGTYIEMEISHGNTIISFDVTNSDDKSDIVHNLEDIAERLIEIDLRK